MASAGDKFRVWDSYWQDNRLYSAGADDPQIAATLDHYWTMAVRKLTLGAAVLDIACGKRRLLRCCKQGSGKRRVGHEPGYRHGVTIRDSR